MELNEPIVADGYAGIPQPLYPVLVDLQLTRAEKESDQDLERENFIRGKVDIYRGRDGDVEIASCEFSAGERLKKKDGDTKDGDDSRSGSIVELRAVYAVGLRNTNELSDEVIEKVFASVAKASAWQLYRSLFAHVVSQCTLELPQLPPDPEGVESSVMQGETI